MSSAKVVANNSSPVNLRSVPNGPLIKQIPQETIVEVIAKRDDTWSLIKVGNTEGYMMTKFLSPVLSASADFSELKKELKKVLQLLDQLEEQE